MQTSINDSNGQEIPKPLLVKPVKPGDQASLFSDSEVKVKPSNSNPGQLNDLQRAQLQDCLAAGATVKIGQVPSSMNRGCDDTPLFEQLIEQKKVKLFEPKPMSAPIKKAVKEQVSKEISQPVVKSAPGLPRYMLDKDHITMEYTIWDTVDCIEVGRGTHAEMKNKIVTL